MKCLDNKIHIGTDFTKQRWTWNNWQKDLKNFDFGLSYGINRSTHKGSVYNPLSTTVKPVLWRTRPDGTLKHRVSNDGQRWESLTHDLCGSVKSTPTTRSWKTTLNQIRKLLTIHRERFYPIKVQYHKSIFEV